MAVVVDTGKIGIIINWIRTVCPEREAQVIDIVEKGVSDREIMQRVNDLLEDAFQKQTQ